MNKLYLLLPVLFIVGFIGVHTYNGTLPQLTQLVFSIVQPLIEMGKSALTRIQTTWATIPSSIQGVVLLAIPSAFAMFFAWTKSRAMQKLQQTQLQASQQIGSLNTQMQTVEAERDTKIGELEAQLKTAQNSTSLQVSLKEATDLVTQKQQEIHDLQLRYQGQIDALHDQIERAKLKVHEITVVK